VDYFPETAVLAERRSGIEQRFADYKSSLAENGLDITYSIEIGNDIAGNIMLVIDRAHIDMLVISTHGLSVWRPLIFGSIAEQVTPATIMIVEVSCPDCQPGTCGHHPDHRIE
jgi:nucleotide-binding universal stress UspA family protein